MSTSLQEAAVLADKYGQAREERLAEQRKVDKIKNGENQLKAQLMAKLEEAGVSTVGGKAFAVSLKITDEPTVTDWDKVYAFITEHDAFDLIQRRLSPPAVRLRWEDEITIPGVATFPVAKLSLSKA